MRASPRAGPETTHGGCRQNRSSSTVSTRRPRQFGTLFFQGVPIFASPILSFPTSDRRKSGFLTPSLGLSSNLGTDIRVPYYFNLAPNYDYTLTPRVMTKRGVLFENEVRYLDPELSVARLSMTRLRRTGKQAHTEISQRCGTNTHAAGVCCRNQLQPCLRRSLFRRLRQHDRRHIAEGAAAGRLRLVQPAVLERRGSGNQESGLAGPARARSPPYERVPQVAVNGYVADWHGFEAAALLDGTRFENPHATWTIAISSIRAPRIRSLRRLVHHAACALSATYYSLDPHFNRTITRDRVLPILSLDCGSGLRARRAVVRPRVPADARAAAVLRLYPVPRSEPAAQLRQCASRPQLRAIFHGEHLLGLRPHRMRIS